MELTPDASPPPSREVSPAEYERRSKQLDPGLGPLEDPGGIVEAGGEQDQQDQQYLHQQPEEGREGPSTEEANDPAADDVAAREEKAGRDGSGGGSNRGEEVAEGRPGSVAPLPLDTITRDPPSTLEVLDSARATTVVGSEPSADVADPGGGGGDGGGTPATAATRPSVTSVASISVVSGGHSGRGLALLSRGELGSVGSRGIQGIRGTSKSFTTGRISPSRQIRSVNTMAAVREPRIPSAHSSRPASSAIAVSSVPPSPDPYGSEGPPGTGTKSLWPPGSAMSASGYHLPGSALPLDDVGLRGAAMKLRTNSSIGGKEAAAAIGRSPLSASVPPPSVPEAQTFPPAPFSMPSALPMTPLAAGVTAAFPTGTEQESPQPIASLRNAPSLAMGTTVVAVGRNRPLLMPFLERQAAALAAAAAAGDQAAAGLPPAAAAAMALALAPAVGRRQGPQGSLRHGSACVQQPQLLVSSSQSSAPRDSSASVTKMRRSAVAKDLHGAASHPLDTAFSTHTPAATAEEGPDDLPPTPTLYPAASREWEKPPQPRGSHGAGGGSGGSYAAGGGAAAVKAAAAASGSKAGGGNGNSADLQLQQQLMLGEAIQIRSIHKTGAAPGLDPPSISASGLGLVGVPGRRGRRVPAHPANASATAMTVTAYFAGVEASIAEGDKAADRMLLPCGLARRLKAARLTAQGPPRFQRRQEPPPPPTPAGIKLDGFMLLEAADEEMPEAVQFASLESRHISAVESADLLYFIALRNLDVSDNKLPDLISLATLQALVRLRAASCRLTTLGRWPGSLGGAADGGAGGATSKTTSGTIRRRNRKGDVAGGLGSNGATEQGDLYESWSVGLEGNAQADTAAATAPRSEQTGISGASDTAGGGGGGGPSASSGAPDSMAAAAETAVTAESSLVASLLARVNGRAFQYLQVLDLSFNQLQPHMVLLPTSPLALLPRLAELDLSSNHLKHLPSPLEIMAAATRVAAAAAAGVETAMVTGGVAFPALRRLRLADNGLKANAIASLAALAPPLLTHLDLSHNAISEAPRLKFLSLTREDSFISVASNNHVAVSNTSIGNGNSDTVNQAGLQKSVSPQQLRLQQQGPQPRLSSQISAQHLLDPPPQSQQGSMSPRDLERFSSVLTRLSVLDLTFNKVASEGAILAFTHLPALQRLLLAGNPLAVTARPSSQHAAEDWTKLDFGEPNAGPARPTVAASLTNRFARIPEAAPKQQANILAAAATTVITAVAAPERVTEAYDRLDATIEQWRLNTVMEEDEEEDEEEGEEEGDDRTFLTGVGIQERRRKNSTTTTVNSGASADTDAMPEAGADGQTEGQDGAASAANGAAVVEERPLWESITDPTERLAVALGLDPVTLPMHTGTLTTDSAGAIAALRFALAHPLVEANDGLGPHPGYLAGTTATQLKRKPRRPTPTQRLAPMAGSGAAAIPAVVAPPVAPKAAKIQTVEAMLEGMKGKLAALEASLAAQLAAAPTAPSAEAVRRAEEASRARYGGFGRRGNDTDSEDGDDDGGSTGSGLPEDVIDQIERESDSEDEEDERAVEDELGPMDPKQGIVLVAEQLEAEASAASIGANGNVSINGADPNQSAGRGGLSSSPPSRVVIAGASPRATGVSPRRVNTIASVGGTSSASPRKGVSIAGAVNVSPAVSTAPVALPGGAASALGYAS